MKFSLAKTTVEEAPEEILKSVEPEEEEQQEEPPKPAPKPAVKKPAVTLPERYYRPAPYVEKIRQRPKKVAEETDVRAETKLPW